MENSAVIKSNFDLSENNSYVEVGVVDNKQKYLLDTIFSVKDKDTLSVNQKIDLVEDALLTLPQATMPVNHSFAEGLYIRQFTIPKGVMLTSKYHKTGQFDVMLTGRKSVLSNEGVVEMVAPYFGVSKPGLKRLAYVHEDVIWIDIHANPFNIKDIPTLEKALYADSYEELVEYEIEKYRLDFAVLLKEYNLTAEEVRIQSEKTEDRVDINLSKYFLKVSSSRIEGLGVFSTAPIKKAEEVGPAVINNCRTQLGRYTNHSCEPNAVMHFTDTDAWLVALRTINQEEITIDYRQSQALSTRKRSGICLVG